MVITHDSVVVRIIPQDPCLAGTEVKRERRQATGTISPSHTLWVPVVPDIRSWALTNGAATTYHRGRITIEASLHETTDPRLGPDAKAEGPLLRDLRSSVSTVLDRSFGSNEALKFAAAANHGYYGDDPDTMWWLAFAIAQGGFLTGGGHYIKGGSQALSDLLVERIKADGGEARPGCEVSDIVLDAAGRALSVRYRSNEHGETVDERAPVVFANAAPHVVAGMLPEEARHAFMAPYVDKPVSISLFSITLGLERPPAELGVTSYSTFLLPEWMTELRDYKRSAELLATDPGERLPGMVVCDHNHIDSGTHVEGDLYTLGVVGVDRLANWTHLDEPAYHKKIQLWLEAIVRRLDEEWPGLAGAVAEQHMVTARTMHEYLNTPDGAVFGWDYRIPKGISRDGLIGSPVTSVEGLWLASSYSGMLGGFSGAIGGGTAAARAAMAALHP